MKKILFLTRSLGIAGVPIALIEYLKLFDKNEFDITVGLISDSFPLKDQVPDWIKIVSIYENKTHFYKNMKSRQTFYKKHKLRILFKIINQIEKLYESKLIKKYFSDFFDISVAFHQGICTKYVSKYIKAKKKIMWYHSSTMMPDCKEKWFTKCDLLVLGNPLVKDIIFENWKTVDKSKVISIPPLVDFKKINALSFETIKYKKEAPFSILTVSRLTSEKGIDLIFKTAYGLKLKNIDFKWFVVGDGYLKKLLEEKITELGLENYLILLGTQKNPYPYFKIADLYVSTSYNECFGISVAEAKMFNLPIIATKTKGSIFQIDDKKNGYLTDFNSEDIVEKILLLTKKENYIALLNHINFNSYRVAQNKYIDDFREIFRR